jgi:PiT family inorganic phosphate transporter
VELAVAIALALAFSLTNGVHDASNSIATLVATRAARPAHALVLATSFSMLGALVLGTAVAGTVAGIVTVHGSETVKVVGAGLAGAIAWNALTWWRGLPSSSGHALVGGLVGATLADTGSGAVRWGGFDGWHPVGVTGVLVALAVSPVVGLAFGLVALRSLRRGLRRATRRVRTPINASQWAMAAGVAFSHGGNDGQKSMGAIAALLLADGRIPAFEVPFWAKAAAGAALTVGTAMGGWRIVRTIGRRIYPLQPLDSLASETTSAGVILAASALGAPVSTTQVVATSVVGTGIGRRRFRHVRWAVVRAMAVAWLTTMPAAAALSALALLVWRQLP